MDTHVYQLITRQGAPISLVLSTSPEEAVALWNQAIVNPFTTPTAFSAVEIN